MNNANGFSSQMKWFVPACCSYKRLFQCRAYGFDQGKNCVFWRGKEGASLSCFGQICQNDLTEMGRKLFSACNFTNLSYKHRFLSTCIFSPVYLLSVKTPPPCINFQTSDETHASNAMQLRLLAHFLSLPAAKPIKK